MDKQQTLPLDTDVHDVDKQQVAEVLVEVPARNVNQTFDYLIPDTLEDVLHLGSRVIVPFGPRKVQGYVLNKKTYDPHGRTLKTVEAVLDENPPLNEELIALGRWMSKQYICLLISALQAMLPSVLKSKTYKTVKIEKDGEKKVTYHVQDKITTKKVAVVEPLLSPSQMKDQMHRLSKRAKKQKKVMEYFVHHPQTVDLANLLAVCHTTRSTVHALEEKGILRLRQEEVRRDPFEDRAFETSEPLALTEEQQTAVQKILRSIMDQDHRTFLLHGVTGSGKTEIYLQSIAKVLKERKQAIVLVPEITLTPQMVSRFKGRFGDRVAVLHSRLSAGERYDEWRKIQEGEADVAIGARSALFAPFARIGLIIIDEEHESSYKQEETPKYHARDVAIFRGRYHQAPVILGSATPALESYARAGKNVYELITLQERVHGKALPPVEIVDMRQELRDGNRSMFSQTLHDKIKNRLENGEQFVLFLNRRGFSTFVMCRDCGYVLDCPHCDISLTYHKVNHTHRCHYCGYTVRQISHCPECNSEHIRFFGTGTQKVEEELYKHFPGMRVIRMDVDTTRRKGSHEKLLQAFGEQKADCLLGTQMIAKGLDFENVTLVGVLAADAMLHLPDFRSAERTFQLLTQVSGRAGRHELPGEVVVQSYTPDHYSIQHAASHDYEAFYAEEMKNRHQFGYPPYYYLTLLTFTHEDIRFLVKVTEQCTAWLRQELTEQTLILGPVASPVPKIKDRYRYHCMIKYRNEPQLSEILQQLQNYVQEYVDQKQLHVHIDMQPQMFM